MKSRLSSDTLTLPGLVRYSLRIAGHTGGLGRGKGGLFQGPPGPPVESVCQLLCPQSHFGGRPFKRGGAPRCSPGPLLLPQPPPGLPPPPTKGSSAGSPGLGASRLLTSHWLRAPGKRSRGGAAVQIQGRHLGGKFRGRAVGGAEGGEVPGVGRLRAERASGLPGSGECGGGGGGGGGGGRGGGRGNGGAAAEGSSSPVPSPPSAQLREPRAGRGDVERGRAGEPPRDRPGCTPAPSARHSLELCGRAAGVGARGGVHVGREGVAESGRCPVRPSLE